MLENLCENDNDEVACYDLGLAVIAGRGTPKDVARGHALLARGGNRYPTLHLAHDAALGRHGMKLDLEKAAQFMENACQGDYDLACHDKQTLKSASPSQVVKLASVPNDEPVRWCAQSQGTMMVNCHGDHGTAPQNGHQSFMGLF